MAISQITEVLPDSAKGVGKSKISEVSLDKGDPEHFQAAMDRHMQVGASPSPSSHGTDKVSLGDKIMGRATELASGVKKDQQYVSKMLEQATRTGDSMQLMKAMLALNDFSLRTQAITKTVSKAGSSVDQLTKLQ